MKRVLLALLVAIAAKTSLAEGGEDAYLLMWMVNNPTIADVNNSATTYTLDGLAQKAGLEGAGDLMVRVAAKDTTTGEVSYLMLWETDGEGGYAKTDYTDYFVDGEAWAGPTWASIGSYKDPKYVFAVEIGNYLDPENYEGWNVLATSQTPQTFDQLYQDGLGYITPGELSMPDYGPWTGGAMVTPEPTSGMLVLFGLSFLALRRKRQEKGAA